MDRPATGRIGEGDGRRVRAAPWPIVAGDRPEVALLDAAAARIEHRRLRLVDRDLARGQDEFAKALIDRPEFGGRIADPERQHRALDVEALGGQHLGLPIERQMPSVFGDQHGGDHRLGRQAALDQPLGRRRLNHRLLAGAAGIFGTVRHEHPELRRDHVEPLRDVLADHMHRRAAARAVPVLGLDRHVNARQMGGQRAAVRPALLGPRRGGGLVLLVVGRLAGRDRLLDVLQRQSELVRIELLGFAAELHALQLAQKMREAIVLPERRVALDDRGVPLGQRRRQPRLQRVDVGRRLIRGGAHAQQENQICSPLVERNQPLRTELHDVASGAGMSRACRRDQSSPSTSAASCEADSRITPSLIGGQRNAPSSSRFQYKTRPEPSQAKIFNRSARFERKTKIVPENGSR